MDCIDSPTVSCVARRGWRTWPTLFGFSHSVAFSQDSTEELLPLKPRTCNKRKVVVDTTLPVTPGLAPVGGSDFVETRSIAQSPRGRKSARLSGPNAKSSPHCEEDGEAIHSEEEVDQLESSVPTVAEAEENGSVSHEPGPSTERTGVITQVAQGDTSVHGVSVEDLKAFISLLPPITTVRRPLCCLPKKKAGA